MNRREYQRQWRVDHPGYSREWNEAHRKGEARNRKVSIFGILVKPNWMPIPVVSKEQAEKEFLEITKEME